MVIYYDSKTGNVERFIAKVHALTNWKCVKISDSLLINEYGHLITYTTKIGSISDLTTKFMEQHSRFVHSVSSSGNMNWGENFARAADKITDRYNIPTFIKFELSGLERDVNRFVQKVKEYADKKMDTPQ